jgi:hypothetical protein
MGKKKKKSRSRVNRLSPITKSGQIRVGTLLSEMGVGLGIAAAWNQKDTTPENIIGTFYNQTFSLDNMGGKLLASGIVLGLIGKFSGFRDFGLIRLS